MTVSEREGYVASVNSLYPSLKRFSIIECSNIKVFRVVLFGALNSEFCDTSGGVRDIREVRR